tara:strand:- start:1035 stop:1412 length:378 start_codon:yes stop_codon:yes gene_type:complete
MIRKHNQISDFVDRATSLLAEVVTAETPADLYGALDQLQAMVKINKDAFRAELETSESGPVAMGRRWIVHMVRSKRTTKAYSAIAAECGIHLALLGHRDAFEAILEKNTSTTSTLRLNVEANTIS